MADRKSPWRNHTAGQMLGVLRDWAANERARSGDTHGYGIDDRRTFLTRAEILDRAVELVAALEGTAALRRQVGG
ncbi:MAG: hypothetical protein ACYCZN_01500 [Candidatus Dormibacteria bacterium]